MPGPITLNATWLTRKDYLLYRSGLMIGKGLLKNKLKLIKNEEF